MSWTPPQQLPHTTDNTQLTGPSFLIRTIPDITPNTKIVAVCGIHDWPMSVTGDPSPDDLASPKEGGMLFSDFYLFHHLLRSVSQDQVWLTSFSPGEAVAKYGGYVHGSPATEDGVQEERRVVLGRDMLPLRDVQVVSPGELRNRFLEALSRAKNEAEEEDRPLLVLMFANNRRSLSGAGIELLVGGSAIDAPDTISVADFKCAIGSRPLSKGICLLTTAVYGGEWAVNPDVGVSPRSEQSAYLESLAWPVSGTIHQRPCGPEIANVIAQTLLRMTLEDFGSEDYEAMMKDDQARETYEEFETLVRDTVLDLETGRQRVDQDEDTPEPVHFPSFSAQHDEWGREYSPRAGIALDVFHAWYLQLKSPTPTSDKAPELIYELSPGGRRFTERQLLLITTDLAQQYLNNNPGPPNAARNIYLHGAFSRLVNGQKRDDLDGLLHLYQNLDYRMNQIMHTATVYKNYLGLDMPDSQHIDVWNFNERHNNDRYYKAVRMVIGHRLFHKTPGRIYYDYPKGVDYVALAITKSEWTMDQAKVALDGLVYSGVPNIEGVSRIMHTIHRWHLNRLPVIREKVENLSESLTHMRLTRRDWSPTP